MSAISEPVRGAPVQYADGWERLDAMPVPEGGMTQEEIAAVVGCSKANIWMLEQKAIAKLLKRHPEMREWLK